jgi:hypothetical protein
MYIQTEQTSYKNLFMQPDHVPSKREVPLSCQRGGVVVSVLGTETKGRAFEPGQSDGFLRAIKIRSIPFFGWEVKPEVSCHKILWHVKDLLKFNGDG